MITRSGEETETELSVPATRAIGLSDTLNGDFFDDDDGVSDLADISGDDVLEDRDEDGVWRTEDSGGGGVASSRGWSPTMTEAAARTLGARLARLQET